MNEPQFHEVQIFHGHFEDEGFLVVDGLPKSEYNKSEDDEMVAKTIARVLDDGRVIYFDELGKRCPNAQEGINEALKELKDLVKSLHSPKYQVLHAREMLSDILSEFGHKNTVTLQIERLEVMYQALGGDVEKIEHNTEVNETFVVGKSYRYSEIPQHSTDEYEVYDYGDENLGKNAVHVRYHEIQKDIWFIWDGVANEAILKCVYNS